MNKNKLFQRILTMALSVAMVVGLMPATALAAGKTFYADISKGDVSVGQTINYTKADGSEVGGGEYSSNNDRIVITGTTTEHSIAVDGVDADITLDGVDIQVTGEDKCAFELKNGAAVNLTLKDDTTNTLTSGENCAGLQVSSGDASSGTPISGSGITIDGGGTLKATGGEGGAGIGGNSCVGGGNITIKGGIITARGNMGGAGIGGGTDARGGTLTIKGGTIDAGNIGCGANGESAYDYCYITGGSVYEEKASYIQSYTQVSASYDTPVYMTTVTLEGIDKKTEVSSLSITYDSSAYSYGTDSMYTDESGKIYLWLPKDAEVTGAEVGEISYTGSVTTTDDYTTAAGTLTALGGSDEEAPTVESVTPNGTDAATSGDIAITFSEAMDTNTTGTVSLDNGVGTLSGGTWSGENKVYQVSYSELANDTEYNITISGFKDVAGNEMTADSTHTFTTKAAGGSSIWDGTTDKSWYEGHESESSYTITNGKQLAGLAKLVNDGNNFVDKTVKLGADIVLNDVSNVDNWDENTKDLNNWIPIGLYINQNNKKLFSGTFDGDGHTVSGIYISTVDDDQGLFGYIKDATVKNVGVTDSYIKGGGCVGGVVGYNYGTVQNCYNTGSVTGSVYYVGGVAGYNNDTVQNCYNTGSITGIGTDGNVGGMVGYNYQGTVRNCYNTGSVTGSRYVGGVAGYNESGTVENCYNTGSVTGSKCVGGVVGNNSDSKIQNCYNTGSVNGSGNYVGGVVGYSYNDTVQNCYNTGSVTGNSHIGGVVGDQSSGGTLTGCYYGKDTSGVAGGINGADTDNAVGKSTAWMKNATPDDGLDGDTTTFNDWDGKNVWIFEDGKYPKLKFEGESGGNADEVAPTVGSVTPSGSDAAASGDVVITFSEAMDTNTTGTVSLDNGVGTLSGGTWSESDTVYTVSYSELTNDTEYAITISGFKDVAGNEMSEDKSHTFTTTTAAETDAFDYANTPESGTMYLRVEIPASGGTFAIPLFGRTDGTNYGIAYDWSIDWGDMNSEKVNGNSSQISNGIAHTYASGGTYTIAITPNDTASPGWFRAFGSTNKTSYAGTISNLKMITGFAGVLDDSAMNLSGDYCAESMFYNCWNLTAANLRFSDATAVGAHFAANMFYQCQSLQTLPDGFNLPSNFTSVGDAFAGHMFHCCYSLKALPKDFNLPQNVTSVGVGFAGGMFYSCTCLESLPENFTLPATIQTIKEEFASSMFNGCGKLKINSNFRFPALKQEQINLSNVFKGTFQGMTTRQYKGAAAAILSNLPDSTETTFTKIYPTGYSRNTFSAFGFCNDISWNAIHRYWKDSNYPSYDPNADYTEPTVGSVTPSGSDVAASGDIAITFSEAMDTNTAGTVSLDNSVGALSEGTWSEENKVYKVSYSELTNDTEYTITISGFKDAAGNVMLEDTHTFTTKAAGGSSIWDGTTKKTDWYNDTDTEFTITTAEQLAGLAKLVNGRKTFYGKTVRLGADIVLNDVSNANNWDDKTTGLNVWTAIGMKDVTFAGIFDGDGHKVSGIYINTTSDYQGLFGCIGNNSIVKNLGVTDSYIKGQNFVGGVVGYTKGKGVQNCYNTGRVSGNNYVGGVAGYNDGSVTNSYNTGSVNGVGYAGGVAGVNNDTVKNSYNTGSVNASGGYVGGVVGFNNPSLVTNCYNAGSVDGSSISYVGGVAGYNKGTVKNSYNTGSVNDSNSNKYVGGVAGYSYDTVENCYYDKETCTTGGIYDTDVDEQAVGKSTAWMKNATPADGIDGDGATFTNWDGENVWIFEADKYPYFKPIVTDADAVAAAKAALTDGSVEVASGATQEQKTAAVQTYVDNLLKEVSDAKGVTATVTYNSDTQKYDVSLAKGGESDSTSLSMTVIVADDPDIKTVEDAKTAAADATYSEIAQSDAANEGAVKAAVEKIAKDAVNDDTVTVTITDGSYTDPTAGTSADPEGTDGSYSFTVTVEKGTQSATTKTITFTIKATEYVDADTLTGTATITGNPVCGETLTATLKDGNSAGTLFYQWTRDGQDISGATESTYTLTKDDVGAGIAVKISSDDKKGTRTSAPTSEIAKVDCEGTATAPVVLERTDTTVTLVEKEGYEYGVYNKEKDTVIWQNSNTFTGLDDGMSYSFYQRIKETDTHKASDSSDAKTVTTKHTMFYRWNYEGAVGDYTTQAADLGDKLTAPTTPQRAGYTFDGWYTDSNCKNQWNFNTDKAEDSETFYAKWNAKSGDTFEVTYAAGGATSGKVPKGRSNYKSGDKVTVFGNKGNLSKIGASFAGWSDGTTTYKEGDTFAITDNTVLTAVWTEETTQYTVTFSNNYAEGGTYTTQTVTYGSLLTKPATPTRDGYSFVGWYKNAACTNPWSFDWDTVTENMTLYTKWAQGTYSVNGTVEDDTTPSPNKVEGATVKIMKGNIQFGNTVLTDADGKFSVNGIPNGEYNIVIKKNGKTVTLHIKVDGSDFTYKGQITLPTGNKNSKLDIVGADTPNIVEDGLDDLFKDSKIYDETSENTVNNGGTVEIRLTVQKEDNSAEKETVSAQMSADGYESGIMLDVEIEKTVTDTAGVIEEQSQITALDDTLTLLIPLPAEVQGKSNYIVYRTHDYGATGVKVDKITTTKNANNEYIEISGDKTYLTLHAKFFSTYAIGYSEGSDKKKKKSSSSSATPTTQNYTITVKESDGGSISPSGSVSVEKGKDKTFTFTPKDGYIISDVLIDGKSVGAVDSYTFKNMDATHTIKVIFAAENAEGLPYYLDSNDKKVFIGFASNVSGTMKYIAPEGEMVQFAQNPKNFNDISGHWAKSNIEFITQREIFVGTEPNTFSPNSGMTRAMFATVIGRLYERSYGKITATGNTFSDVPEDVYYSTYVSWAEKNGVIKGVGGNKFDPERKITREEMAAILYRFAEFLKVSGDFSDTNLEYADIAKIDAWAIESVKYCQENKIVVGRNDGSFAPQDTATRAEVATILKRFVETVVK